MIQPALFLIISGCVCSLLLCLLTALRYVFPHVRALRMTFVLACATGFVFILATLGQMMSVMEHY